MRKPVIAIKLSPRNYAALADLGDRAVTSMTGNASFATPSPALTNLQIAITDVNSAITKWGQKGNRGSHADLVDLRVKARLLADMLKAEAQYVQNTAQGAASTDYDAMAAIIVSSGFQLAGDRNPQGVLQKVQNLHQFISRKLNRNEVKLKWKKPLNVTSKSNVKEYKVLRANSTDIATAVEVAIVTKTSFIDSNNTGNVAAWTYLVIAYNAAGAGVTSDPVTVAVLGV